MPAYRPSGKCPSSTTMLRLVIILGLVTSLVTGGVYYFVTKFFDLVILMPLIFGAIVGGVLSRTADLGKCRNVPLIVTVALVAGILTYGTKLAVDAFTLRPEMVQEVSQGLVDDYGIPQAEAVKAANKLLTPIETMKLYFRASADIGFQITHYGSGGIPIRGIGYYLFLALDVILVAGAAVGIALATVKRPFCENCDMWITPKGILLKSPKQADNVVSLVQVQDWNGAYNLPAGGLIDQKNHCNVFVNKCAGCGDSHVWVTSTSSSFERNRFYAALQPDIAQRLIDGGGKLQPLQVPDVPVAVAEPA